jgi:hypothetical protein
MGPLQAIDGDVILLPPFIYGSRFRVRGSGFKVQGSRFRVQGSGFKVQGSRFRVQGSGFSVQSSGFFIRFVLIVLVIEKNKFVKHQSI